HEHTKRWSGMIEPADAFVFITCEYNYGFPAPLKNALDFIYQEWNYKPVAFVSYGGIGAGVRAVQMIKEVITTQKMVPLSEAVHIPFFVSHINDDGVFIPTESIEKSAHIMMKELLKWTKGLKAMRDAEK
ncbi:MAG: NADPH-dependent FMN reductase, partial [Chitinophagaceae bacterium]